MTDREVRPVENESVVVSSDRATVPEIRLREKILVCSEQVHESANEDRILTELIAGKFPASIFCDGVGSAHRSGELAEWMVGRTMQLVSEIIVSASEKNVQVTEIREMLKKIVEIIDAEARTKKHELGGKAMSTLVICLLYYPKDHPEEASWWMAGIGNGEVRLIRKNKEVIDLSPRQVEPSGLTNALPTNEHTSKEWLSPNILTARYEEVDMVLGATDGIVRAFNHISEVSKSNEVFHELAESVMKAEDIKTVFTTENIEKVAKKYPNESALNTSVVPIKNYSDDLVISVIKT